MKSSSVITVRVKVLQLLSSSLKYKQACLVPKLDRHRMKVLVPVELVFHHVHKEGALEVIWAIIVLHVC